MQMLDTLRRLSQSVVSARRQQRRHELVYDTAHASNSHGFPYSPTQRLKGNARQIDDAGGFFSLFG
jgi:hypothetical protein